MEPNTRVGIIWTDYARVEDGEGGYFMEPQGKIEVRLWNLDPEIRAILEAKLEG